MAIKTYNDQNFVAIANAIRSKSKNPTTYKPSEMAAAISAIESGFELLPQDTVSGALANFPDGSNNYPVVELIANIAPKQAGSGDPTPDNVRPISGSTECKVTRYGVNLWDEQWEQGYYNYETGEKIAATNRIRSKNDFLVKGFSSIYLKASINIRIIFLDENKDVISSPAGGFNIVVSVPNGSVYARFFTAAGTSSYNNDISINYPSSDTSYHAYNGVTKTIDLGRTVYGGTLNVTTGELTVNSKYVTFNSLTWYTNNLNGAQQFYSVLDDSEVPPNNNTVLSGLYCDSYLVVAANTVYTDTSVGNKVSINTGNALQIRDYSVTTLEDFKEKSKNFVLVYPLANPEVYQLDPEEVKTLLGVNNISADTGNVSVTYRADVDLYIAKKIAEGA